MRRLRRAFAFTAVAWLVLLIAGCSGGKAGPTPLAGQSLASRDPVRQAESCAPASDPLALVLPSLVRITTPPDASGTFSSGTGIIVDQNWVLTNEHVVDGAANQRVRTFYRDGHFSMASVVASSADLDLALLQANTGDLPAVAWGDEGKLNDKSVLFSVGYELGAVSPSARQGRFVSSTVDRSTGQAFIVSDLQLQHGDSGGPLLNRCGQVIGINTARIQGLDSNSKLGLSIPGYGARRWAERNRSQ
ncbi:MAG TPA: serine protease [Dehalococcoidia bacterium]|nr:serine protease [Dehalococcoidia bacterium]